MGSSIIHRTFSSTRNSAVTVRPPLKHFFSYSGVTHDSRSAAEAFVATLVTARMNAVMVVSLSGTLNHHAWLGRNPFFSPLHLPLLPLQESIPRAGSNLCFCKALRADKVGGQGAVGSEVIRRPIVSTEAKDGHGGSDEGDGEDEEEDERRKKVWKDEEDEEGEGEGEGEVVDWEDKILEDTVPLVGFVRMVLHSGEYGSGDRLKPEHEKTITEKLLPYHPEAEKKIGCGIDYITVGYHPDFEGSRCLFVVRKDGEMVDFSYWKCIKGLIRKKYPLHADSFILRHFRRRRHDDGR